MKLAFLFSDGHHTLHLVNARIQKHRPTNAELEETAREAAETVDAPHQDWDFIGAIKNGVLAGPIWFEPADES